MASQFVKQERCIMCEETTGDAMPGKTPSNRKTKRQTARRNWFMSEDGSKASYGLKEIIAAVCVLVITFAGSIFTSSMIIRDSVLDNQRTILVLKSNIAELKEEASEHKGELGHAHLVTKSTVLEEKLASLRLDFLSYKNDSNSELRDFRAEMKESLKEFSAKLDLLRAEILKK